MYAHIVPAFDELSLLFMFYLFIFSFENLIVLTSEVGETCCSYTYSNGLPNLHCMLLKQSTQLVAFKKRGNTVMHVSDIHGYVNFCILLSKG